MFNCSPLFLLFVINVYDVRAPLVHAPADQCRQQGVSMSLYVTYTRILTLQTYDKKLKIKPIEHTCRFRVPFLEHGCNFFRQSQRTSTAVYRFSFVVSFYYFSEWTVRAWPLVPIPSPSLFLAKSVHMLYNKYYTLMREWIFQLTGTEYLNITSLGLG